MNEKQSLKDTIQRGFYRYVTADGKIKLTNGKRVFQFKEFAETYQHFEVINKSRITYYLNDQPDKEPWPLIDLTVDFEKPYGKIPMEPLLNIAPEPPIKSDNNNEDVSIFWTHIENLCGNVEQDVKEWVKDWIADIFQNPMKKSGTALTFRSDEGTGKGLFFDYLMSKLLGERHLSTCRAVFGERFNGEAKHKLLINFDEGSWNNTRADIGSLKKFITDKTFSFEDKGKDVVLLPNHARTVFTTNSSWVIKNDGSRRFCMLNPIKENYCSKEYFDDLSLAIENDDKIKKFLYELENRKITHSLQIIPKTEEYYNQEIISYDYYDSWLEEILNDGEYIVGNLVPLWDEFEDVIKICQPKLAVTSFNNLYKHNITKSKLYRSIEGKTKKFGYTVDSVVKNECGRSIRVWEFKKIIKPEDKITEVTEITDITEITQITENLGTENANNLRVESGSVTVISVINEAEVEPEKPKSVIIRDLFMGTPMKKFDNGSAVVDDKLTENTEFVTINKLIEGSKTAKDENVETYASFVFELDNEDIESQKERAKRLFDEKVINRAVFSGGKSIHCRITVQDEPSNKEEYKYVWKKLNELYFEGKADTACSNPARLTRTPNAERTNGIKQERLHFSEEILNYEWRTEYEKEKQIKEYVAEKEKIYISDTNERTPIDKLLERNIPIEARKLIENSFVDGERHEMIPKAIGFLKHCGYELNEIERLVKATGIKDGDNYVKNIFNYLK